MEKKFLPFTLIMNSLRLGNKGFRLIRRGSFLLMKNFLSSQLTSSGRKETREWISEARSGQASIVEYYTQAEIQDALCEIAREGCRLLAKDYPMYLEKYYNWLGVTNEQEYLNRFRGQVAGLPDLLQKHQSLVLKEWFHTKKWKGDGSYEMHENPLGYVTAGKGSKIVAKIDRKSLLPFNHAVHELEHLAQQFLQGNMRDDLTHWAYEDPYMYALGESYADGFIGVSSCPELIPIAQTKGEKFTTRVYKEWLQLFQHSAQKEHAYHVMPYEIRSRFAEISIGLGLSKEKPLTPALLDFLNNELPLGAVPTDPAEARIYGAVDAWADIKPYIHDEEKILQLINSML